MRTTNNLFRKVHNYTHLSVDLLSLYENKIFWRFFIIFNMSNVFFPWKNCKFQSSKSSTGTSSSMSVNSLRKPDFRVQNIVVSVCCPYLSMGFPYIRNIKYPHGRTDQQQRFKSKREISNGKDCVTFHRTAACHCCHSLLSLEAMYDSWSALPLKYEPGQNRIRTFLKTPVVFSGFSLLSPERSSLAVFAVVQDVVHPVFHVLY